MDLDEVFARPLTPEDFQRLRSAWKIPNDVPDKHIMKYINSQKSKGTRIGEGGMEEADGDVQDIRRRAGMTTNWRPDDVSRAMKRIEDDMVALLDEIYGIEGADEERRMILAALEEAGTKFGVVKRILQRL